MIDFRRASSSDKALLAEAFKQVDRCLADCECYFAWREADQCEILLAENKEKKLAGYSVLLWKSRFKRHAEHHIPEMMDLYIYPLFRRLGIATALLHHSEQLVRQAGLIKLGLGVSSSAYNSHIHNLYLKAGYHTIGTDHLPEGEIIVYEKELQFE